MLSRARSSAPGFAWIIGRLMTAPAGAWLPYPPNWASSSSGFPRTHSWAPPSGVHIAERPTGATPLPRPFGRWSLSGTPLGARVSLMHACLSTIGAAPDAVGVDSLCEAEAASWPWVQPCQSNGYPWGSGRRSRCSWCTKSWTLLLLRALVSQLESWASWPLCLARSATLKYFLWPPDLASGTSGATRTSCSLSTSPSEEQSWCRPFPVLATEQATALSSQASSWAPFVSSWLSGALCARLPSTLALKAQHAQPLEAMLEQNQLCQLLYQCLSTCLSPRTLFQLARTSSWAQDLDVLWLSKPASRSLLSDTFSVLASPLCTFSGSL